MTAQSIFASILRMTLIVGRKLQLTFFLLSLCRYDEIGGFKKMGRSNLRHGQTRLARVDEKLIAVGHTGHADAETVRIFLDNYLGSNLQLVNF